MVTESCCRRRTLSCSLWRQEKASGSSAEWVCHGISYELGACDNRLADTCIGAAGIILMGPWSITAHQVGPFKCASRAFVKKMAPSCIALLGEHMILKVSLLCALIRHLFKARAARLLHTENRARDHGYWEQRQSARLSSELLGEYPISS